MATQLAQRSTSTAALNIHLHPKQWTALDTNATESVIAATSGISPALAAKAATNLGF
jgi:hypothetical protein